VVLDGPVFHLRSLAKYAAADFKKSRSFLSVSFSRRNRTILRSRLPLDIHLGQISG